MNIRSHTIETCEGTVCSRCKINIDMCACRPTNHGLRYRSMNESISAQGLVPETQMPEQVAA